MTDYTLHAKAILALDAGAETPTQVAKEMGVTRETAHKFLRNLAAEGLAETVRGFNTTTGRKPDFWRLK